MGKCGKRTTVAALDDAQGAIIDRPERHTAGVSHHWDSRLVENLYGLLYDTRPDSARLDRELGQLIDRYGEVVYSELIHLLSDLRFEPAEASEHWRRLVAHRASMQDRLGEAVDLRVALVSYFVEVDRKIENPKIIELRLFEQTRASAYRDELTGLANYRLFREHLGQEFQRVRRNTEPLSLVMIDVDDFKRYNDRNGHEAGNDALVALARLLTRTLRKIDISARYGGEEFALLLPGTSKLGARLVAERIRERVGAHPFPGGDAQPGGKLTISIGVATYPGDAEDSRGLVGRADGALYVAKARGKDQTHLYGENRRSNRRIPASLNGQLCLLAADEQSLTTVNISEEGLLFVVDRALALGSIVDVKLTLPGAGCEIATSGKVVRVQETDDGQFHAAIRITRIGTKERQRLAEFVRQELPGGDEEPSG